MQNCTRKSKVVHLVSVRVSSKANLKRSSAVCLRKMTFCHPHITEVSQPLSYLPPGKVQLIGPSDGPVKRMTACLTFFSWLLERKEQGNQVEDTEGKTLMQFMRSNLDEFIDRAEKI